MTGMFLLIFGAINRSRSQWSLWTCFSSQPKWGRPPWSCHSSVRNSLMRYSHHWNDSSSSEGTSSQSYACLWCTCICISIVSLMLVLCISWKVPLRAEEITIPGRCHTWESAHSYSGLVRYWYMYITVWRDSYSLLCCFLSMPQTLS